MTGCVQLEPAVITAGSAALALRPLGQPSCCPPLPCRRDRDCDPRLLWRPCHLHTGGNSSRQQHGCRPQPPQCSAAVGATWKCSSHHSWGAGHQHVWGCLRRQQLQQPLLINGVWGRLWDHVQLPLQQVGSGQWGEAFAVPLQLQGCLEAIKSVCGEAHGGSSWQKGWQSSLPLPFALFLQAVWLLRWGLRGRHVWGQLRWGDVRGQQHVRRRHVWRRHVRGRHVWAANGDDRCAALGCTGCVRIEVKCCAVGWVRLCVHACMLASALHSPDRPSIPVCCRTL